MSVLSLLSLCLLLVSLPACSQASGSDTPMIGPHGVAPANVDPTDFQSAIDGYNAWIDSLPYGKAVGRNRWRVCTYHALYQLPTVCGDFRNPPNLETCCEAIRASIDQGKCLCHQKMLLNQASVLGMLTLISTNKCRVDMPVTQTAILDIPGSEECSREGSEGGSFKANPQFLRREGEPASSTIPDPIPTFGELFDPLPPGPFNASFTEVTIPRSEPSSLVTAFSKPHSFDAIIVYPAEAELEKEHAASAAAIEPAIARSGGKFPIVAFSPGFLAGPDTLLLAMKHLASQGMIVVSQKSSQGISSSTPGVAATWPSDMADGLVHLRKEDGNRASFLFDRVDFRRAATAGHSFGGMFAIPAARLARQRGVFVRTIVPIEPGCEPFGDFCGFAVDALPDLFGARFLFIVGSEDHAAPLPRSLYLSSLVPANSLSKIKLLDGVNHCVLEVDPAVWPMTLDCGIGSVSPMESARRMQQAVSEYLVKQFNEDHQQRQELMDGVLESNALVMTPAMVVSFLCLMLYLVIIW